MVYISWMIWGYPQWLRTPSSIEITTKKNTPAPWTLICTTSHTWRPSPPEAKVSRRHQHGRAHATPGPFERHNFCAQRDKKIFVSILKLLKFTGFPWRMIFVGPGNHGCLPYDDVSWGCFFLFREKGILYQVHRYQHILESRYCIPIKRRRHRIPISQVAEAARSHTTSKAQCCKPRAREQWTPLLVCFIGYNSLVSSQINPVNHFRNKQEIRICIQYIMCIYICVCVNGYIYMYIYLYIHIMTYININSLVWSRRDGTRRQRRSRSSHHRLRDPAAPAGDCCLCCYCYHMNLQKLFSLWLL